MTHAVLSRSQTALMVSALIVSVVAFQLNTTMLIPAIHTINEEFGGDAFATMSTYFSLAGAVSSVVLIRWSDYVGRKRVLLGVMVVMCVGTVLCIVSTTLGLMVVGRILQGGSVITFGLAFLIMREHLSGPAFGTCCGLVTAINGGVAGFDSLLGGVMVDRLGYRSIFVLSLTVGIAALAFAWKAVPADHRLPVGGDRMDWWGAILLSLTAIGANLFLTHGAREGWLSPLALGWIVTATAALVALVVVDSRLHHPLVAIEHLRSREAWPLIVATTLCIASFMTVLTFIVPSIGEDDDSGFALDGTTTALLLLTPAAVVQLITAPLAGRLAVRIGFVTVLRAGVASSIVVTALLALFVQNLSMIVTLMIVFGFTCTGVLLTAVSTLAVVQAPDDEPGSLPGINGVAFGIGGAAGFAWAGPVVGTGTVASFQTALWTCVAIGIVALIFSVILKPKPGPVVPG
ncbi:arabinose efflux permease family protein [Mycobacterium sp. JS623]|uniref:MFS transporter n=1 Tax=Mycobacterium sp. JS623 TaxID=212767 RepID=UPI0002A58719|nr:MFS transporter [Mycobacterium sp. JS623]AGB25034.1 arabinose efflux permease family protein [Mycobacterium sp. JS623]